jgi:hypothetical protein
VLKQGVNVAGEHVQVLNAGGELLSVTQISHHLAQSASKDELSEVVG